MASALYCWRGETLYLNEDIQQNPSDSDFRLQRYRIENVITKNESWEGARIGCYGDALLSLTSTAESASITSLHVQRHSQPGVTTFMTASGKALQITVLEHILPEQRLFPFYSEVNSNDCFQAFCSKGIGLNIPEDEKPYHLQGKITHHAIRIAREFGIEPVKQSINWFDDTDATEDQIRMQMNGDNGYKKLVLEGAIAPPIIWCGTIPDPQVGCPSRFFLEEINNIAPAGTMAWCADEPSWNGIGNGMPVNKAVDRAIYVHTHAPFLIPMITTGTGVLAAIQAEAKAKGVNFPIIYCIVQNHDTPDLLAETTKGSYFSCMAQGCGGTPLRRTTFPVAVIEGDPINDFQSAITLAQRNHASFVLYYKITKNLITCWQPGGLYNCQDGGNGDGTAMYVNQETGLVMPSIRMMHWHIAQQRLEKLLLTART